MDYPLSDMASRHEDWLRQAERDIQHAQHALEDGDYEWACFAAQQAAEKAVKALYQKLGASARRPSVTMLLSALPPEVPVDQPLLDKAKGLDKQYIPPRYPDAYPIGAPFDFYTQSEAERAIEDASGVIEFCRNRILP
jgi:HEPN domain-containing protein